MNDIIFNNLHLHIFTGVAGVVINDKGEMLVIQERFNVVAPHWKLPGGLADKGTFRSVGGES